MWYLDLRELGLDTEGLADYFGLEADNQYRRFPLVAFEIEASDSTTKTMEAGLANLQTIGAPFGILVVDEEREVGLANDYHIPSLPAGLYSIFVNDGAVIGQDAQRLGHATGWSRLPS